MTAVFLDTSGLYATGHPGATHHDHCRRAFRRLVDDRVSLVTTEIVLAETHALALARSGPDRALRLLHGIADGSLVEVVPVDAALRRGGIEFLRSRPGRRYSLADAISFGVMRDRGISRAFTLDTDFAAEGFTLLPDLR